jgi:hypothetical protein
VFTDAGQQLTLVSPKGGQPPIDPTSTKPPFDTEATRRFDTDEYALAALANTGRLTQVDGADFDAVFYPGGHGPLFDLAEDPASIALIEDFYAAVERHHRRSADHRTEPGLGQWAAAALAEFKTSRQLPASPPKMTIHHRGGSTRPPADGPVPQCVP